MDLSIQDQYHAISFPIYQTATFSRSYLGEESGFDYTRQTNPTRSQLEKVMASLENGKECIAFASGMAAVTAVMALFDPGDHIIVDEDLYGGSVRLFNDVCKRYGLEFTYCNCATGDVGSCIRDNTKAVYLETPTNPMMHVTDIEKLSKLTKDRRVLLIVDNTFLSPFFQNPLDLGADIVIHSGTKYIGGHHDTIGGLVILNDDEMADKIRLILTTTGAGLSPFDSWLMLRGVRTLAVRMERSEKNARAIAEYLVDSPHVTKVMYPGLQDQPGYEIMKKQARGFGSMISFEVESGEFAVKVLNNVELFYFAESLGGTETLITYPLTQTHAAVPEDVRARLGINDRLLRLSVGIEGAKDLIEEIDRVFAL